MLRDAPQRVIIPLGSRIGFALPADPREYTGKLLSQDDETLVLEVGAEGLPTDDLDRITLSYISQNAVWHVRTRVTAHYERWWFVARPLAEEARRHQRRQAERMLFDGSAIAMPVDADGTPCGAPTTLALQNLGVNGCYAIAEEPQPVGTRLLMHLTLPGVATANVTGEVVRQDPARCGHGIQFVQLPAGLADRIAAFVRDQIEAARARGEEIAVAD
jgi:hypothetical protein